MRARPGTSTLRAAFGSGTDNIEPVMAQDASPGVVLTSGYYCGMNCREVVESIARDMTNTANNIGDMWRLSCATMLRDQARRMIRAATALEEGGRE